MGIRELSLNEIAVVAGGADEPTYLGSTGTKGNLVLNGDMHSYMDYMSIYDNYGEDQGGTSDGPEVPEVLPLETDEQIIDKLMANLAVQIMAMPDWQSKEYVALVYKMPNGEIVATAVYPGTAMNATEATALARQEVASNLGTVIAMVHNHPANSYVDPQFQAMTTAINNMPSDNDWVAADVLFKSQGSGTLYLIGVDGVLREFEYSDKAVWDQRNEESYYRSYEERYDKWLDSAEGVIP